MYELEHDLFDATASSRSESLSRQSVSDLWCKSSTETFLPAPLLTLSIVFHRSTISIHPFCAGLRGPFMSTIPRLTASHSRKRRVMTYLKLKDGKYCTCLKRMFLTLTAWVRALICGITLGRRHKGPVKSEVSFN